MNSNRGGQHNSRAVGKKIGGTSPVTISIISANYPNAIFAINRNGAAIFWTPFFSADRCQAVGRKRVCENIWPKFALLVEASKEVDFI